MQTVMWLCLVLSTWSLIVSINPMHSSIMIICISDKWQHRLQAALNYIRCVRGYSPPHLCSIAKNCRKVFRFCAKRSSKKTLARSVKKNFRLHLRLPRYLKNKFKKLPLTISGITVHYSLYSFLNAQCAVHSRGSLLYCRSHRKRRRGPSVRLPY